MVRVLSITDTFIEIISELLYSISQAFLEVLYYIEQCFSILTGSTTITNTNNTISSILSEIIFDKRVEKIISILTVIGLGIFIISLIIGIVKANMSKDTPGLTKKTLSSSLKAIFLFIGIPFIFLFSTLIITNSIELLVTHLGRAISVSNNSFKSSIANSLWINLFNKNDRSIIERHSYNFTNSYGEMKTIGVSLLITRTSYKYILSFIVSFIMFISLGIATIKVAIRVIKIVILYVISPPIIGVIPLDYGEKMERWKDEVVKVFIGVCGNIISMYIYILSLSVIGDIINKVDSSINNQMLLSFIYIIFAISGAIMCAFGEKIITNLFSFNVNNKNDTFTFNYSSKNNAYINKNNILSSGSKKHFMSHNHNGFYSSFNERHLSHINHHNNNNYSISNLTFNDKIEKKIKEGLYE